MRNRLLLAVPLLLGAIILAAIVATSLLSQADAAVPQTQDVVVASSLCDVEERPKGEIYATSSDLELVTDGSTRQTVGLRFAGLTVPAGATVTTAYVQFQTDETGSAATSLAVGGQAADDAPPFTTARFNVSSRARTSAAVSWSPPAWTRVGEAGTGQRTPDLSAVLQEIVDRSGWSAGNAVVLIITGSGKRVAEAYDGSTHKPVLHLEFTPSGATPSPSPSPTTTPSPGGTITPTPSPTPSPTGRVINVPGDASTVQGGINMAATGDTVLVGPGTYTGGLSISGKTITLASRYLTTGDSSYVAQTVLDGGGGSAVIKIGSSVGPDTRIIGFTIRKASDGVYPSGPFQFLNNRVTGTGDGIDLESGARGVIVRDNVFEANSDDAIDFDGASQAIIEGNRISASGNDGIEIRLHSYTGPTLEIVIRNNVIENSREDGIQLIDYEGLSSRVFRIHNNLITGSTDVGLGLMCCGDTTEDFQGASIPEPIHVYNNTFANNPYSITGGDTMTVRNNIFYGSTQIALKNVDANSTVAYSLFWNNRTNHQSSNVDASTTIVADPVFDGTFHLQPGSPAIDAGVDVGLPYNGTAPDLGAYETPAA